MSIHTRQALARSKVPSLAAAGIVLWTVLAWADPPSRELLFRDCWSALAPLIPSSLAAPRDAGSVHLE